MYRRLSYRLCDELAGCQPVLRIKRQCSTLGRATALKLHTYWERTLRQRAEALQGECQARLKKLHLRVEQMCAA